jgi:tRNA 2-selenouridine synthase
MLRPFLSPNKYINTFARHFSGAPITTVQPSDLSALQSNITHVIDVRTPSEYEHDRVPQAINLPVLHQHQHHEVGTHYKGNPFQARKVGAAHVSNNIATMLDTFFQNHDATTCRPLIYCWRGGQRSQSLAHVLSQIGYQTYLLQGGYKSYRQQVVQSLKHIANKYTFVLLSGMTGSGKTKVLERLHRHGHQVIDLEELAEHRGSLLGHTDGTRERRQPSQKLFETRVNDQLQAIPNANNIVWLEAESNKIGNVHIPTELWAAMKRSKRIALQVPIEERVRYTMKTYQYWMEESNRQELMGDAVLGRLKKTRGKEWCGRMVQLVQDQRWADLVQCLLKDHYDVLYQENENRYRDKLIGEVVYVNALDNDEQIDRLLLPEMERLVKTVVPEGHVAAASAQQ